MSSLKARRGPQPPAAVPAAATLPEIVIGTVRALDPTGAALVDFDGNAAGAPVPAMATGTADAAIIGRSVALAFLGGDRAVPIVLGVVTGGGVSPLAAVERDRDRLVIEADQEIVLRCGKASITLTRAGKVLVRGAYVSSRSSGMQRITGASVHIN